MFLRSECKMVKQKRVIHNALMPEYSTEICLEVMQGDYPWFSVCVYHASHMSVRWNQYILDKMDINMWMKKCK